MNHLYKYVLTGCVFFSQLASAETVSFDATQLAALNPGVSDSFQVNLLGSGFTSGTDGGGVNFTYDPAVLRVDSLELDPANWDFFADTGLIDNSAGTVTGVEFATSSLSLPSDFVVGTVAFTAVGVGTSILSLSESFGIGGWALLGDPQDVSFVDSSVTVSAVPLPASFWLLTSGIVGLFGATKRRKEG